MAKTFVYSVPHTHSIDALACPNCESSNLVVPEVNVGGRAVICVQCGLRGPNTTNIPQAVKLWNTLPRREKSDA